MMPVRSLVRDCRGGGAAEFGLVLPLLLIFLFAIIDGGRFLYTVNQAEKATQAGVRMAAVIAPVASGLPAEDYVGVDGLTAGDTIPASALDPVVCDDTECTCSGNCPADLAIATDPFDKVVERMQEMFPEIEDDNVEVVYQGSGLGFAGDPAGMDVAPLVTVRLKDMSFTPITLLGMFDVDLPGFASSLTAEDMVGTRSN